MTKDDSIQTPRVALLIDADNIGDKHAEIIFARAATRGNVIVRKAYGVFSSAFKWKKESMFKYAIEPVARHVYVSGKNITDIVLVIDAMDLAHRKIADVFCIASSDSDFTPLAMKLRESGAQVFGFGEEQTPESFRAACDEFYELSAEDSETKSVANGDAENDNSARKKPADFSVRETILAALEAYSDENGWANLGVVGNYLRRIDPSFSPKKYGFSKLTDLAESFEEFEIERNAGTSPRIRKKD